jgi:amino acid transporter/mannitol/fructose-specific phosphotransferase system IIA component (Ntr-type)
MTLKRELNLFHVFCIATGAMVSSGLFILPGLAYAKTGPSVILSYILAGIFSLAGMLSLTEMTTAMPRAGGDCFTIIRSMGPGVGTVTGLFSWFSLAMKSAFALIGMAVFTIVFVDMDIHIIAVLFCLVFLIINLIGIKEAARTQSIMVLGLLIIMVLYIFLGISRIDSQNLEPLAPKGTHKIFFTAGFVFVSYAGLLKVASVAEEIKNPSRNIPLGMILSLVVVMILYTLMVLVTVGVMDGAELGESMTPISDGASVFMGQWGVVALSLAAILAFLSTANAGIMTAARSLVPLSQDGLIPEKIGNINKRFGTPHNALLVTGVSMIIFLFLALEILVEAASVTLILINILSCLSVIILREGRLRYYRPTFKTPFYPWLQIFGILSVGFLLLEMGTEAIAISIVLVLAGIGVYLFYGRIKPRREYALLHLVERITAKELVKGSLESELKEILRERDDISRERFKKLIESCRILDLKSSPSPDELTKRVAHILKEHLKVDEEKIYRLLLKREKETSVIIRGGVIVPSIGISGRQKLDIILVRCREGILFSDSQPPANALFIVVSTRDEHHFYLNMLMWITRIVEELEFEHKWLNAKDEEDLRKVILTLMEKEFLPAAVS